MQVLVLGGTGFIGGQFVSRIKDTHQVTLICRDPSRCGPDVACVQCDLAGVMDLCGFPSRVDAVVHLAQSVRYREFPEGAADVFSVNVASVAASLRYALDARARSFVLVSSGAVYEPFSGSLNEDSPLCPQGLYASSKAAAELLTAPYRASMNVTILRPFFPYGPGQSVRFLPALIQRIEQGRPVQLDGAVGDGSTLSLLHVNDMVAVLTAAMEEGWKGTFNVASPESVSIRHLSLYLGALLDKPVQFEHLAARTPVCMVPPLDRLREKADISRFIALESGLQSILGGAS